MNRRALLKAAPALAMAGAVQAQGAATITIPSADTAILRLYRQHQEIIEAARQYPSYDDDELDRLFYDRAADIEDQMMALPSTCAADFAAKVVVDTCRGNVCSDWDTGRLWAEARALIAA